MPIMNRVQVLVLLVLNINNILITKVFGVCPGLLYGTPILEGSDDPTIPSKAVYEKELTTLNIENVFKDLYDLMYDSQECWPADSFEYESNPSYAGLMIRQAWHCAGTFRISDNAGGCGGGRQRYMPENSWQDNVNLDKGRALLAPIKETYGDALSWGDLIIFAGTAAISQGGGPVTEVCAGRIDDLNGKKSETLVDEQYCTQPNNCSMPLGTNVLGLIYVDPVGYLHEPDPSKTAPQIRNVFSRMDWSDKETVALIGGGHTFGKTHGACKKGNGPGPDKQPYNPWPSKCGSNLPNDAWTSGIELQWTTNPFTWDNEFFTQLINDEYELINEGPGGEPQWKNKRNGYGMMTTDVALIYDEKYKKIVEHFANDMNDYTNTFGKAWEKLVTNGGEWANNKFCVSGDKISYQKLKNIKHEL